MKISRNWLQTFFEKELPSTEKLIEGITMHAFEVEGVEKKNDDEILDVKILPNRSHDCLCHYGVAKEVSTIFEIPLVKKLLKITPRVFPQSNDFSIEIKTNKVKRFKTLKIKGVKVSESPKWLKERIEAMGGRSINNIVDITNFVMFELGQPMHAFDADKIISDNTQSFVVREAKKGEKTKTLDGVERELTEGVILITDGGDQGKTILGIAGIKGGSSSEITDKTKNIILEAANFDAPTIRKHSKLLGLRTDASIRFENDISPELPSFAISYALELIEDLAKGESFQVEGEFDFVNSEYKERKINISLKEINSILGTKINKKDVSSILSRLNFDFKDNGDTFEITAPFERLDLEIPEDIAEEVGRIYGLEHIESEIPEKINGEVEINQDFYKIQKIRRVLIGYGCSEVYTYSMVSGGEVEIENPIASDKSFMRSNLSSGIELALKFNSKNSPVLGLKDIKLFEIGKIFTNGKESISVCLGSMIDGKISIEEFSLEDAYEKLKIENIKENDIEYKVSDYGLTFKSISPYPFALRDIAVWVPENIKNEEVEKMIKKNSGEYLIRIDKFDEFKKDGKISYAYHLVFQSMEKTLNDEELNKTMTEVTDFLNKKEGFKVR